MQTNSSVVYLDSSAVVKLIVAETESVALRAFLATRPRVAASALVLVEVVRAVRPSGQAAVAKAHSIIEAIALIEVDRGLLYAAAQLEPPLLRSLDAIHLAAALSLGGDLDTLVTYDRRMADAATRLRLEVQAPGSEQA